MSAVIAPDDRKLLVFVAVFVALIVAALALLSTEQEDDIYFPSSYSAKSHGAKAAYLLLRESGYNVNRWEERPSNLPKEGSGFLLILAEPFHFSDRADQQALKQFVVSGGRVLAIGFTAGMMLPDEKVVTGDPDNFGWKQYQPQIPSRFTRGGAISMERPAGWRFEDSAHLVDYGTAKQAVVVSYVLGKGEIMWWGSASPITNAGITRDGNLQLFLDSIGPRSTHILWDEYFHGSRPSIWSYAWGPALAWGGIQFGIIAFAVVFGFSRRSGPIRPLAQLSRLSPLEFVETLGALYHRAQASWAALDAVYQRFRSLLCKRLGLRNDIAAEQMVRSARERLGYKNSDFGQVLTACEAALQNSDISDGEALRLIQALHKHRRNLELAGKPGQENN
jgi:hypothetical protein